MKRILDNPIILPIGILAVLGLLVGLNLGGCGVEPGERDTAYLVALTNSNQAEAEGSVIGIFPFVIGSLSSKQEMIYTFMVKHATGGIVMKQVPIDRVLIYEDVDADSQPYCKLPLCTSDRWILHVRCGTVVCSYRVDVKAK